MSSRSQGSFLIICITRIPTSERKQIFSIIISIEIFSFEIFSFEKTCISKGNISNSQPQVTRRLKFNTRRIGMRVGIFAHFPGSRNVFLATAPPYLCYSIDFIRPSHAPSDGIPPNIHNRMCV